MNRIGILDPSHPINLAHPLNRGLRARWKVIPNFRGGRILRDLCRHNGAYDGTWHASATPRWNGATRPGSSGALDFSGAANDHVTTGDTDILDGWTQFTINCWVNQDASQIQKAICGNYSQGVLIETDAWDGQGVLIAINSGSNQFGYINSAITSLNEWELWTIVFDGSQTGNADRLKFYLNATENSLAFSGTIPAAVPTVANEFRIGANHDGRWFDGQLDDLAIHDCALGASEIRQWRKLTQQRHSRLLNYIEPAEFNAAGHVSPYYYHHLLAG